MNRHARQNAKPATLTAGCVVLRHFDDQPHFLLLRTYSHWDFPKGLLESGETPLQAALRETGEETGITDLEFRWGEIYRETERYGHGKIARFYLTISPADNVYLPVSPELGHPEHHEFHWLRYKDARELLVPRLQNILDWARQVISESPGNAKSRRSE